MKGQKPFYIENQCQYEVNKREKTFPFVATRDSPIVTYFIWAVFLWCKNANASFKFF